MTQNESIQTAPIKHPEQGRSMIEMLGTLAIMGVLSIGGIAGYGYAINKYRANETIDELNKRAIVYATQLKDGDLLSGTALSNGEFGDKTSLGYGVSATVSEYENEFNVAINSVPFEVCEQILKNYTIPAEISVNGRIYSDIDENIDICGEGNTDMVFAFNGDLSNDWENVEISGTMDNVPETTSQCQWVGWVDSNKPDFTVNGGDVESIDKLCVGGVITDIQCRAKMYPSIPLEELGQNIICNTEVGLVCKNSDQSPNANLSFPYCLNYEISVYCCKP